MCKTNIHIVLKLIVVQLALLLGVQVSIAQLPDSASLNKLEEVILPTIDELFVAARSNAPIIKYYQSRTEEEKHVLSTVKQEWLNYIRIIGGYQYGHLGSNSYVNQGGATNPVTQISGNSQSYYDVGVAVSIPIDQISDRRNRIKRQKEKIEQTKYEVERYFNEQKLLITESYTEAVRCLALLKVRSEALRLAEAQYKVSLDDFSHNKITASDLSRMKNIHSNAVGDFELIRAQLVNALIRLEILSGQKFLN